MTSPEKGMSAPGAADFAGGTDLSPLERRVVQAVDAEGLLGCLSELVAIPSLAGGEAPAQELVAARMAELGLETDVWEIDFDELRQHAAYTADVDRPEGLGVVGTLGREEGATLILNGHVDVVPPGELDRWSYPPWRATALGGRVFGRGTADMKGGLSCALYAAKALRDAGVELGGTLRIQSVIGEEDGGAGTLAALIRGHGGDGAVVLEPTRLAVSPAQAGALSFRVTVPGRAAHGAFREEGVDPVEKFVVLYRRLRELEAERNRGVEDPLYAAEALPFALAVGKVRAGIWPSTVAETLVFEGRLGVAPGEEAVAARRAFEAALLEVASADPWLRDHPPRLEWPGAQFEPARTSLESEVVTTLCRAFGDVTGASAEIRGMRYGADMRLLVNVGGIPTVLFGPGDVRDAHRPDESVAVAELVTATRVLAVAALRFCEGREG